VLAARPQPRQVGSHLPRSRKARLATTSDRKGPYVWQLGGAT
jgi:hypothetical protein